MMEDQQLPKTNAEWANYYESIIAELTENQKKIGKIFKVVIDRKKENYYIGRTQFDSPDVDNEVLISCNENYLKVGSFVNVKITDASDFDLYAVVTNDSNESIN